MNTKSWSIAGMLFTLILGILLHFTYAWSEGNLLVAIFSVVNESIWEYLKLLFTPMFLFAILEFFAYGSELPNFIPVRLLSILLGMITITTIFYTYVGIMGDHVLVSDIGIFILGILAAYSFSYKMLQTGYLSSSVAVAAGLAGLLILLICFFIFTFNPPQLPLFQDPFSLSYGISLY